MRIFRRLRRAAAASIDALGSNRFRAGGAIVRCPVCAGDEFLRAPGDSMRKPLLLRLNAPWLKLDARATRLICAHCAFVMTFGRAPELARDAEGLGG